MLSHDPVYTPPHTHSHTYIQSVKRRLNPLYEWYTVIFFSILGRIVYFIEKSTGYHLLHLLLIFLLLSVKKILIEV